LPDLENFKTTRDDYKLFKATFMEWCAKFGLSDWEIQFSWEDAGEPGAMCGGIATNTPGRNANVYFAKTWSMPVTRQDVLRTAVHEFSHLLIANMEHLANSRYVTENEIGQTRESLARRFENAFYPVKH
jgi:hypothetical protein